MSKNAWMIGAGEYDFLCDEFAQGMVAVGWNEAGEIRDRSQRELRRRLSGVYPDAKADTHRNVAAVLWRFAQVMKTNDVVVTYDPVKRQYLIGEIAGNYRFEARRRVHPHIRETVWHHRVSRDHLSMVTWNSLNSPLTLFAIPTGAIRELYFAATSQGAAGAPDGEDLEGRFLVVSRDGEEPSREPEEDKILALDSCEVQELVELLPID